ncbi:hypothetical protein Y032_0381g353 [Ancylostoma ceylanicum]|uniref:Uncharacterized protein n=1 Tax=Ancylostoma ceylanicum TaxID=53326 RepID=A0A016RT72_9BILA|nr:hypothetical protein Y032_0381g353 [Ancylostoma ceylanicum]
MPSELKSVRRCSPVSFNALILKEEPGFGERARAARRVKTSESPHRNRVGTVLLSGCVDAFAKSLRLVDQNGWHCTPLTSYPILMKSVTGQQTQLLSRTRRKIKDEEVLNTFFSLLWVCTNLLFLSLEGEESYRHYSIYIRIIVVPECLNQRCTTGTTRNADVTRKGDRDVWPE